jgi:hypothetical protein
MIYGVDLSGNITPLQARDALVECFGQAHCADSGLGTDDSSITNGYVTEIVKKAVVSSGGDYEKPTKQSMLLVIGELQEFAKNFRDQSIIQEHAGKIMQVVNKLK